ncbi:MAG: DnaJ domain-containing protein [Bacilli bacterium]|nr:DnaJ domain-containing protein [Bacilli bacterium]
MLLYEARAIFNLPTSYTKEDVTKTYRKLMMKWHPDVNKTKEAEEKAKQINEAKSVLLNGLGYSRSSNQYSPGDYSISKDKRIFIDRINERIGKFNAQELNAMISNTINKIKEIIKEIENSDYLSSYDVYYQRVNKLFIEYARIFCNFHGLNFQLYNESICINSALITYKNSSFKDFVDKIDQRVFKLLYNKYLKELLNYLGHNGEKLYLKSIGKSDSEFVLLYDEIEKQVIGFQLADELNNVDLCSSKVLYDLFSTIKSYIVTAITLYIINYCREKGLIFSIDNVSGDFEIEGVCVPVDCNIFAINNLLRSITKPSSIRKNNYDDKSILKNNNDDKEFILKRSK